MCGAGVPAPICLPWRPARNVCAGMEKDAERKFSLLMVDDEVTILSSLKRLFRPLPYELHTAQSGEEALENLHQTRIDAALIDLMMPGMTGIDLLNHIRENWPSVKVMILTGYGGVREAVEAIQSGAIDFLQKPFENENLLARIDQLYQIWRLEQENRRLKDQIRFTFGFDQLIGNTNAMLNLKRMILQVSRSDASILVQGETGTGKELVARAIHHHSTRKENPFVPVDCASINESVIGSELFGHVKGAFTGAHESTPGLIRTAHKGTLFLDEVGELPLAMQAKLLRTIQEREVRPVGGSQNASVDVRFLAATNRNLGVEVTEGRFRQDLYYRLNVVVMTLPPLRDRRDDIPLLARHFCDRFPAPSGEVKPITEEALDALMRYDWPGNVRELENVIRRAVAMGQGAEISIYDLPEAFHGGPKRFQSAEGSTVLIDGDSLEAYEMVAIRSALDKCGGNRKRASSMLGIGEATLYRKLKKYQL